MSDNTIEFGATGSVQRIDGVPRVILYDIEGSILRIENSVRGNRVLVTLQIVEDEEGGDDCRLG